MQWKVCKYVALAGSPTRGSMSHASKTWECKAAVKFYKSKKAAEDYATKLNINAGDRVVTELRVKKI